MDQRGICCRQWCCRVCDKQEENAAPESRTDARIETKRDMDEIQKEGKVKVTWRTDLGAAKRGIFKIWTSVANIDQV